MGPVFFEGADGDVDDGLATVEGVELFPVEFGELKESVGGVFGGGFGGLQVITSQPSVVTMTVCSFWATMPLRSSLSCGYSRMTPSRASRRSGRSLSV